MTPAVYGRRRICHTTGGGGTARSCRGRLSVPTAILAPTLPSGSPDGAASSTVNVSGAPEKSGGGKAGAAAF